MQKGRTLVELAQAVQDAANRKVDVVTSVSNIDFDASNGKLLLTVNKPGEGAISVSEMTGHALNQTVEYAGIPNNFFDRIVTEHPALAATNLNTLVKAKREKDGSPSKRMVRLFRDPVARQNGLTDIARAFVSNKFSRSMEHETMLAGVLPILVDSKEIEVVSTQLTDRKMYIKCIFPNMKGEVRKGDIIRYGFALTNGEIGGFSWAVEPFYDRLWCDNGAVSTIEIDDAHMRKAHIGRAQDESVEFYQEDTIRADDTAITLKLRDTLNAMLNKDRWQQVLGRIQGAASRGGETADPIAAVERVSQLLVLPKPEQNNVLANFLKDGDFSRWGLMNAITKVANDERVSYDRACELERIGPRILTLPESQWSQIAAPAVVAEAA